MTTRIHASLARRRDAAAREEGFSLIELLVVVIIIGILAAIAIPIYIGVQDGAKDSAVKSDLTNAKLAVVAYYSDQNKMPATISSTVLKNYGYASSSVTNASVATAKIDAFCLKATSTNSASTVWYITQDSAPTSTKPATCS